MESKFLRAQYKEDWWSKVTSRGARHRNRSWAQRWKKYVWNGLKNIKTGQKMIGEMWSILMSQSLMFLIKMDCGVFVESRAKNTMRNASPTVKFSPSVMVWGCMTSYGLGSLVFIDGSVNAIIYKNIIKNHILPTVEELTEHTDRPIFQDDSAPYHRARIVWKLKTIFIFLFFLNNF